MNCPYCTKRIPGMTGLMEAQNFRKHLKKCRKNPANIVLSAPGGRRVVTPLVEQTLLDAVEIRADSGQ